MINTPTVPCILSDHQWQLVRQVLPPSPANRSRGRPLVPDRACLDGILYVIVNDIPWMFLPSDSPAPDLGVSTPGLGVPAPDLGVPTPDLGGYPPYSTCFRRFTTWVKNGTWDAVLSVLFTDLALRTGVDLWGEWSKWSASTLKHGRSARRHSPFRLPDAVCADESDKTVAMLFLRNLSALLEDNRRRRAKI
jgi:transposase